MAGVMGILARMATRPDMLRVMHNHRAAAYASEAYDGLSVKPVGINAKYCP